MPVASALTGGLNAGTSFAMHQQSRRRDAFDQQQKQVENYASIVGDLGKTLESAKEQFEAKLATTSDLPGKQKILGEWKQFYEGTVNNASRAGQTAASRGLPVDPVAQIARLTQFENLRDLAAEQALAGTQAATAGGQLAQAKVPASVNQAGQVAGIERQTPEIENLISPTGTVVGIDTNAPGARETADKLLAQGYSKAPSRQAIKSDTTTRDITPKTQATIEGKLLDTGDAIHRLNKIRASVKEEHFNIWKRAGFKIDSIKSIFGADLSENDIKELQDFTTFQTETFENFNLYVKSITGAAMSIQEAERIEKAMPVSGEGIKPKQSYPEFISALDRISRSMADIQIRYKLMQQAGLASGDIAKDKAAGVGDAAEAFMSHDEARRQYEARGDTIFEENLQRLGDEGKAKATTILQLKREFGL